MIISALSPDDLQDGRLSKQKSVTSPYDVPLYTFARSSLELEDISLADFLEESLFPSLGGFRV